MWINFKNMPVILKILTVHALACFLGLIFSVVPHGSFSIDGHIATYREWWSSGNGVRLSVVGIILPTSGYFMLKRITVSRVVYLGALTLALILSDSTGLVPSMIFVLIVAAYLYIRKPVEEYFTSNKILVAEGKNNNAPQHS